MIIENWAAFRWQNSDLYMSLFIWECELIKDADVKVTAKKVVGLNPLCLGCFCVHHPSLALSVNCFL